MVPNSQRGVFASSTFSRYWRRVQKSFPNFVGFGKIGKVPDPSFFSTPTFNNHLALPTVGTVSAAISNKTRFAKWHASRGGWICYANDFPDTWSGCDLIVGASSGAPFKREVVEEISAATPVGKGKEKKIKQEVVKKVELEGSVEGGTEAGPKTKKRKTIMSCKQLVISEEPERMDPFTVGKEVDHPFILKIRVKTKVEPSVFQVLVSSSAYCSLGSLEITPQSPLGPSRRTRSRQKIVEDSVERERRARPLSFFSLFLSSVHLGLLFCCVSFFSSFITNEWSLTFYNLSASQTPRELKATPLVMMWYSPLSLVPFYCFLSFFFQCCVHIYIYIYFMFATYFFLLIFSFAGRGASSCNYWCLSERSGGSSAYCYLKCGERALSGGIIEEVRQAVKDTQPIPPSISLAI